MANVLGYIPFRIVADILPAFTSYFASASWAWPTAAEVTSTPARLKSFREAPDNTGEWRELGSIFNDILDNDSNMASDTRPQLTLGDFNLLRVDRHDGTNFAALTSWDNVTDFHDDGLTPAARILDASGGAILVTFNTAGTGLTYTNPATAATAVPDNAVVEVFVGRIDGDNPTPAGGTVATDALRVAMQFDDNA